VWTVFIRRFEESDYVDSEYKSYREAEDRWILLKKMGWDCHVLWVVE
jgi:hypothetical protein